MVISQRILTKTGLLLSAIYMIYQFIEIKLEYKSKDALFKFRAKK